MDAKYQAHWESIKAGFFFGIGFGIGIALLLFVLGFTIGIGQALFGVK